ncbi:MAG: hypothetical protein K0Q61_1797, partial [Rhodococcus erythropolis]|nr:hypothetical protein [Rhodococcus erythropolis]
LRTLDPNLVPEPLPRKHTNEKRSQEERDEQRDATRYED